MQGKHIKIYLTPALSEPHSNPSIFMTVDCLFIDISNY